MIQENAFEYVVLKMAAMLSRPQSVSTNFATENNAVEAMTAKQQSFIINKYHHRRHTFYTKLS